MDNYELLLKINLSYFAEKDEKTEKPTAKKRQDARQKGQVAKSQEVGTAALFLSLFFALKIFSGYLYTTLTELFYYSFNGIENIGSIRDVTFVSSYISYLFGKSLLVVMPLFVVALVVGLAVNFIQVGWHPTVEPLKPKFNKLNPISGFKRLFSLTQLVELAKALVKFAIIIIVIYQTIQKQINYIPQLPSMGLMPAIMYIGNLIVQLGLNIGIFFVFVALADLLYQRYKHTESLKMTKQEVKDEYKQMEGNPQVKSKIRQKMREVSMRRMMQSVPSADVVITNPTHYAVALKYDKDVSDAPIVVAKGVDFMAKRIREKATESGVEIVENVQLARTLYASVDIGGAIPAELYQAVAEILAFVFKLKNKAVS